jgi:F-type H+-transporting ATPase subunit delta
MYARALLEAARDTGELEEVRDEVSDVAAAIEHVPELRSVLDNPELDPDVKASVLVDVVGGEARGVVRNFVRLLAEKGRAGELPEIAQEFDALVAAEERVLAVELTTAYELSDPEAADIVQKIEHASGRPVEATRKVDPELIGGIVLQAGSMRLDASVRGRLQRLRQELTTARS